jgi:hypothetical protein
MKKGLFLCFTVLTVALLAVSCNSAPSAHEADFPPWLNDFPPEDAIWGIGSAKQSSEQMSMTTAEVRARTSIARQLNTRVENMFTDYNRDAGTLGDQASLSLQEDVSRLVTSMQLNGSKPIQRWKAPDNTWWYLVEYTKADAQAAIKNVIDSEAAQFAEFKTDQALKMLDAQLAKNEKPELVDR